jgi:hypothetical protein
VRFESAKFQWLGTFDAIAHTMAIWHDAQVNTVDALKPRPLVIGSFAKGHLNYQRPRVSVNPMSLLGLCPARAVQPELMLLGAAE